MLYVFYLVILCINDEDKLVVDDMGFFYDYVVDENYIVKFGQVSFIYNNYFGLFFWLDIYDKGILFWFQYFV